jgi:hypothetical protein
MGIEQSLTPAPIAVAEQDQLAQALSLDGSHATLGERIHVRCLDCGDEANGPAIR